MLLNTVEGVRSVDEVLLDTGRVYRITGWMRITRLVLPAAAPQMMAGIRQALSIGLILMVISEMFASSSGLGFTIVQFQRAIDQEENPAIQNLRRGFQLAYLFPRDRESLEKARDYFAEAYRMEPLLKAAEGWAKRMDEALEALED